MSITEFVESPAYKKTMGKVYGFGASVVILGALWKILHLQGAAYMLIAGLGTEAIIFFLSAFEPPHEMPDWSLVYPELVGLEPKSGHHGGGGGGSELQALIQTGNIDEETVKELSNGIKKLGSTSSHLADLSDASLATQSYMQNIQNASESVGKFGNIQAKTAQVIEESAGNLAQSYNSTANAVNESANILAQSYAKVANSLTESGTKVAEDIAKSGKGLIEGMNKSGDELSAAYVALSQNLNNNMQGMSDKSKQYSDQLANVNSNLSALNSIYELQLKGSKQQVEATEQLTSGLGEVKGYLAQSVENAKAYSEQVALLSKTVNDLNTIYGNMLSVMNVGNR